jgi:tetratricopeptide (TPR) repeat protein
MPRPAKARSFLLAGAALATLVLAALILAVPAWAQAPARVEVERLGETTRLRLVLPEAAGGALTAEAEIAANMVIVARLSDAIDADLATLRQQAPDYIAMARLDADGRTLRLALNTTLEPRISVSHNVIAIDLAPPGTPAQPDVVSAFALARNAEAEARADAEAAAAAAALNALQAPALAVTLRVGEASDYTRLAFQWPEDVTYSLSETEGRAVLTFSRAAEIDIAQLRADPPRFVDAVTRLEANSLSLAFILAPQVEARVWSDAPGRVVLDLAPEGSTGTEGVLDQLAAYADSLSGDGAPSGPEAQAYASSQPDTGAGPSRIAPQADESPEPAQEPASEAAAPPEPEARPDPVPQSGVVPVEVRENGDDLVLSFTWASLPGAAVFRRSDALWIVFGAGAALETGEVAAVGSRHVNSFRAFSGQDFSALRLVSPISTQADVNAAGATWTITLGDMIDEPPLPVRLARDTSFNRPATLRIGLNSARNVVDVLDPVVGDTLLILTADGEKRGVLTPRQFAQSRILASAHGVAIEPYADDLTLTLEPGGARLSRPEGLQLSRASDPALAASLDRPMTPGFLDLERWRGDQPFMAGRQRLQQAALTLEPEALTALARFNLGWGLAGEAIGYLNLSIQESPALGASAQTAALRGAAEYMMGRFEDAEASLSQTELINDPSAQPWRALVAAKSGDWALARRRFEQGRDQVFFFEPVWRARIAAWHGLSTLRTGDIGAVQALLDQVENGAPDEEAAAIAAFARAGLAARYGDVDTAIERYDALTRDPWTPIQARARLERVRLQSQTGRIAPDEAVDMLESLRFQWRGDDTEVEASAMLGEVYAQAGRFEEALSTMEATRMRFPESRVSRSLGLEMDTLFRDLFLDGAADRMDPLTAVALWREHQQLTPPGPDGVRMVLGVVERLVEVDLLNQAAEYLQYFVDERAITMTAQARAAIAADLAEIYLMDERPEQALRAIEQTRIAGLSGALVAERRLLQARALAGLGRTEHAQELIENDRTQPADRLRARIAWDERRWLEAGRRAEALLGDRWRNTDALSARDSHDVLRALIAYALAEDRASLDRVEARYGGAMAQTEHASAFATVANEVVRPGDARISALVSQLAELDTSETLMRGFLSRNPDTAAAVDGETG